jgi:hypothetical protein
MSSRVVWGTNGEVGIDLYWIPLGAGDRFVRLSGAMFEAIAAPLAFRRRLDLYHAALEVRTPGSRFVIEVAPYIWGEEARAGRGVVADGPVGSPLAGRFRLFRYELRCWRHGIIVDAEHAVDSPVPISDDADTARRLVTLVPFVPMSTWGRDELDAGDMWTSNSVISWLLTRARAGSADVRPPAGGRAPGWQAGMRIAAREVAAPTVPSTAAGERTRLVPSPATGRQDDDIFG